MKDKKSIRVFFLTFWMTLLAFCFIYFTTLAYINSYNIANKDKLCMIDLQRINEEKAVIIVLDKNFEYTVNNDKRKINAYEYALIPSEIRLAASAAGALSDLFFE